MATPTLLLSLTKPFTLRRATKTPLLPSYASPSSTSFVVAAQQTLPRELITSHGVSQSKKAMAAILGAGFALIFTGPASADELSLFGSSLQSIEPANALSLPTWAIHVSSVVEWITAMALVWQYGEKSGYKSWKGLSWGMVPLLGGAFCACTWHFFYNSEALEELVALQAALTLIGNATMWLAAFRIYKASEESSKNI